MLQKIDGVVAHNVERVGHIDIAGGGQVVVQGNLAFIGHMDPPHGTSILDISDRSKPKVLSTLEVPQHLHSHKVRVHGDIMLINNESYRRHAIAAGKKLQEVTDALTARLGRGPSDAEIASEMNYKAEDIPNLRKAASETFNEGGLRIYNIADPTKPKEISFFPTAGNGVHRFDFDGRYAYLSTGIEGYLRNIVVIVDVSDPAKPKEVSRWWLPGQWTAGGEEPARRRFALRVPPSDAVRRPALRFVSWSGHGDSRYQRHHQAEDAQPSQLSSAVRQQHAYLRSYAVPAGRHGFGRGD